MKLHYRHIKECQYGNHQLFISYSYMITVKDYFELILVS